MNKKNTYSIFPKYVLRTPLLSITSYYKFISKKKIRDEDYKNLCKNTIFMEAIFLASPSFHSEVVKWFKGNIKDEKTCKKIKYSILKYYSRMSSRCTPFGLFAGFSVGEFGKKTNIELDNISSFKRSTRLDMNFLVALSQDLVKNEVIKNQLTFYPNSSVYRMGEKIRYIEYYYVNNVRKHDVTQVEYSEYLDLILNLAKPGALIKDLAKALINENISYDDANEFIQDLIQSQLLISEIEPAVTGEEFLYQICSTLEKIDNDLGIRKILIDIDKEIKKLDNRFGNDPEAYILISEMLKPLGTKMDLKYLFQTDMVLGTKKNSINKALTSEILEAFALLNRITIPRSETDLSNFKKAFQERYGKREIALTKALDVEFGIGYKQSQGATDINPLVDDIVFSQRNKKSEYQDIKWSPVYSVLQKKREKNTYVININDKDLVDMNVDLNILPDTISSIVKLVKINGRTKIKFTGAAGSSAIIFFGRFCYADEKISKHVNEIINKENQQSDNSRVFAEIVHLPQSRIGNVIMRPEFREYEIPYLAKSSKPRDRQILVDDLTISVNNRGRLILKSRRLKKEIIPRMANAHNYSSPNSLPIYNFLCDMQKEGLKDGIGISFGPLTKNHEFLPRIEYKNIIIREAMWNLDKRHIQEMLNNEDNDILLDKEIDIFRSKLKLPQWIKLAENDNELLINLNNLSSARMFLSSVKSKVSFILVEHFYSDEKFVTSKQKYYENEIVISFFNNKK